MTRLSPHCTRSPFCLCFQAARAVCETDVSAPGGLRPQGRGAALEEGVLRGHSGHQDQQEGKCPAAVEKWPCCIDQADWIRLLVLPSLIFLNSQFYVHAKDHKTASVCVRMALCVLYNLL